MVNQQQLHKRQLKTSNKTHETNQNFTAFTKGKNTQAREYCVQFLHTIGSDCVLHTVEKRKITMILGLRLKARLDGASFLATRGMRLEAEWCMQRRMSHSCAHG